MPCGTTLVIGVHPTMQFPVIGSIFLFQEFSWVSLVHFILEVGLRAGLNSKNLVQ